MRVEDYSPSNTSYFQGLCQSGGGCLFLLANPTGEAPFLTGKSPLIIHVEPQINEPWLLQNQWCPPKIVILFAANMVTLPE